MARPSTAKVARAAVHCLTPLVVIRRRDSPEPSSVDAALASQQARIDEVAAQRRVIGMHSLENAVDLVLGVVAARSESVREMSEQCLSPIATSGDCLEASVPEERSERGRSVERGPPYVVAFRSLHPCDDTRAVPLPMPASITIVEVAPRDGLQAEDRILSTDVKLELLERLGDAGHRVIEATSFVSPKAVPQLADAEEVMKGLKPRGGVRYTVLIPNETGLERALGCGAREVAVFASASESYSRKNLNRSRDEALAGYEPVIKKAKARGLRVRGYLSMIIADPWDGPTDPAIVTGAAQRLLDFGCDELSLGDTIGVGTPGEVARLINALRASAIPLKKTAFHFHDTCGQALANVLAAMAEGITTFDASVGGIGGSPFAKMAGGNLATEDLVWMCRGMAIETGVDLDKLVATSRWLGDQLGHELPSHVSRALRAPPR
jgi:hydroxymethylglutaryl-CoA lyase